MNDSKFFGASLRGIITFFVVLTLCLMSAAQVKIEEPLYTVVGMVVAFYFGQEKGKTIQ